MTVLRMNPERSVVVLVDYQQRLMPAIDDHEQILRHTELLATIAKQIGVPVIATQQNPSRLGPTADQLAAHCDTVVDKMCFGAYADGLERALAELAPEAEVIIAGCEAHVCLLQTALELLEAGRRVWVVSDASGSRKQSDRSLAFARLAQAGAVIVSTEMVAFEWLSTCEHDQFKAVSKLIK